MTHSSYLQTAVSHRSDQRLRRKFSYWAGHAGEWIAAGVLALKGYRVLERRFKIKSGEVDLVAVRGGVVAFVEVKLRRSILDAQSALKPNEARRSRCAADRWLARQPRYHGYEQRFDAILVVPGRWPVHLRGLQQQ